MMYVNFKKFFQKIKKIAKKFGDINYCCNFATS